MYIVWEVKNMSKLTAIAKYEYKMQIGRPAGWGVLLFTTISAFLDCLPTAANMARVEFLGEIHYYVKRVFAFDGLILLFGLMFLMAGRMVGDRKAGLKDLFMAAPIRKKDYIGGKLLGNLCYALTMMFALLGISICGFLLCRRGAEGAGSYLQAICSVTLYLILPAAFFVAASSVMFPEILDIRFFYLLYSILFMTNAFSINSAEKMPFYIFTQGDLTKYIWQHPKWPQVYPGSALLNLAFLLGTGVLAVTLVAVKRSFWRADE